MPLASRLSAEWRAALLGAAIGVALTLLGAMTQQDGVGLFVAGVVAGYFAPRGVDAYTAGARAGLVTAVPLTAWFLIANVASFTTYEPTAFALVGGVLVVAFLLVVGYFAGGLGAGVGGWVAVQFGKKEPA